MRHWFGILSANILVILSRIEDAFPNESVVFVAF